MPKTPSQEVFGRLGLDIPKKGTCLQETRSTRTKICFKESTPRRCMFKVCCVYGFVSGDLFGYFLSWRSLHN